MVERVEVERVGDEVTSNELARTRRIDACPGPGREGGRREAKQVGHFVRCRTRTGELGAVVAGTKRTLCVVAVALKDFVDVLVRRESHHVAAVIVKTATGHQRDVDSVPIFNRAAWNAELVRVEGCEFFQKALKLTIIVVLVEAVVAIDLETFEIVVHDEVHNTGNSVGTVGRRCTAGQYVNALNQLGRDRVDVWCRDVQRAVWKAAAVHQNQSTLGAETAKVHGSRTGTTVSERRTLCTECLWQGVHEVFSADRTTDVELLSVEFRHRAGGGQVAGLRDERAGDNHRLLARLSFFLRWYGFDIILRERRRSEHRHRCTGEYRRRKQMFLECSSVHC